MFESDAKRIMNWKIHFGKYKGQKYRDIDDLSYLEWIINETDIFEDNPKYPRNKQIRDYLTHIVDSVPFTKDYVDKTQAYPTTEQKIEFVKQNTQEYHSHLTKMQNDIKNGTKKWDEADCGFCEVLYGDLQTALEIIDKLVKQG